MDSSSNTCEQTGTSLEVATFGKHLRRLRKERGMSQQELADKTGHAQIRISYWELDRGWPSPLSLSKLADELEVPITDLCVPVKKPSARCPGKQAG